MVDISDEILAARERLKQKIGVGRQQIGGKGTGQRKAKKVPKQTGTDERKVQQTMKKIGASGINEIEEVRMIKQDGTYMLFDKPKVQASPHANTYMITGTHEEKAFDLAQFLQGIGSDGNIDESLIQKMSEDIKKGTFKGFPGAEMDFPKPSSTGSSFPGQQSNKNNSENNNLHLNNNQNKTTNQSQNLITNDVEEIPSDDNDFEKVANEEQD